MLSAATNAVPTDIETPETIAELRSDFPVGGK